MGRCVVKASNIYYIHSNQPERLYQAAEDYYQRALEYECGHLYSKARINYQKAEEYFHRARDAYKARRQADKARGQADEARKQADKAREQAAGVTVIIDSPRTNVVRPYIQPEPVGIPAHLARTKREGADIVTAVHTSGVVISPQQPPVVQEKPPEKNAHRPISWRGKRHG
jgi:tetratricopeptide (TPR) repeat protein